MKVLNRKKMIQANGILLMGLVVTVIGCSLLGPVPIDLWQAFDRLSITNPHADILFRARLPRVLLGVVVGGTWCT